MKGFVEACWRTAFLVLFLVAFSLAVNAARQFPDDEPETVHITFHVQKGHEQEMKKVLTEAWQVYTQRDMVVPNFHVVLRRNENGSPYFIEIFTWKSHDIPDHMPSEVQAIWKRMNAICEKRDGKPPIDGGEVQLVIPRS